MSIKNARKEIINQIRKNPDTHGLRYKDFGKSYNFDDYSEEEIVEMYYGIYKNNKQLFLLVDGDYFIDMNDVIQTGCSLEKVSYYGKPTKEEQNKITRYNIQRIRTFYVNDYFLITASKLNGTDKHLISRFLWKTGAISAGRNQFSKLYSIRNDYKVVQDFKEGLFPKDLFYPIKTHINRLFFNNDYMISDFIVESKIQFENV